MNSTSGTLPGLIHIYCGQGKGKTTASIGLIMRSAGHGRRILLVQFLKNGRSGELQALRHFPEIQILTGPGNTRFTNKMTAHDKDETLELDIRYFNEAVNLARQGELDLLVLDEALGAIETGLLPEEDVLDFLRSKPRELEVVLTGRNPSEKILELADYISEIKCVRHPWQRGIAAREGIEY